MTFRNSLRTIPTLLACLCLSSAFAAQQPPAKVPCCAPSPAPATSSVRFVLNGVKFAGNTVYSSEFLNQLAAQWIGQTVTFADLEALVLRITEHYQNNGYFLAQALIPRQEVREGVVEFSIIEGKLGKVRIERAPEAPISTERIAAIMRPLQPGVPLRQATLERVMLLLSDLPGILAQSALEQGEEPGSTDLLLEINAAKRTSVQVDADNYGSPSAGRYRAGASLRVNSPLEYGDNLDLRALKSSGGGLDFARLSYERPIGPEGLRWGVGLGFLRYELGADFAALGATGTARILNLALTQPLIRSRGRNLIGKLTFEHKDLEDKIDIVDSRANKSSRNLGAGVTYEARDGFWGGGYVGAGVTVFLGKLDIESAEARALDQASDGLRTAGSFVKAAYQISRMQRVSERGNVFIGLNGQLAHKNLDSSEKLSLGGSQAVRAYSSAEAVADEGEIVALEYRYSFLPTLTVTGFYDAAWGRVNHRPPPDETENKRSLRGYGVGLTWLPGAGISINASVAWRDSARSRVEGEERNPRLYVHAVKAF